MSLKNRLSTVEVLPVLLRKNSTISLPISKPTNDRHNPCDKPKMHSKKPLMPKTQISDVLSLPNSTESMRNCTSIIKKETTFIPS